MLDFNLILQTNRVLLRPIQKDDVLQFETLTNDKSMWIYFTSNLFERNSLKEWVDTALKQVENKTRLAFTIVDKTNSKIIGSTSFINISFHDKRIEIGATWITKEYQGKGINNQIKYLMLKHCFEVLEMERVECKTDVLNILARNALSRIGMKEEGILRSHTLMTHNRRRDTIYYSILKSEWEGVKAGNGWV